MRNTTIVCLTGLGVGQPACTGGDGAGGTAEPTTTSSDGGGPQAMVDGEFLVDVATLRDLDLHETRVNGIHIADHVTRVTRCPTFGTVGPCEVATCAIDSHQEPIPPPSMGVIDVSGPTRDLQLVPPDYEHPASSESFFYAEGEVVSIALAGYGPIPEHHGSVSAPHQVTVRPDISVSFIDGASDLALSFSGGVEGQVVFDYQQRIGENLATLRTVVCRFDAAEPGGVIPAAAFAGISQPGPSISTRWSIDVIDDTVLDLGPWTTTLRGRINAVFESGLAAGRTDTDPSDEP